MYKDTILGEEITGADHKDGAIIKIQRCWRSKVIRQVPQISTVFNPDKF